MPKHKAKILANSIQKGGTGKTTTSGNVAACMVLQGYRVLVVDLDPQSNLTSSFGYTEYTKKKRDTVYEAMFYLSSDEEYDVKDIVLQHDSGVHVIPSTRHLANADYELSGIDEAERKFFVLKKVLQQVVADYDVIIIDTPPALNNLTINAWVASDYYLIPMAAEQFSVEGLVQLLDTVKRIKTNFNAGLQLLGILFNKFSEHVVLWRIVREEIKEHFKDLVLNVHIRQNVSLAEAQRAHKTIYQYDPQSNGAKDFRKVTEVLIQKMNLPVKVK